LDNLTHSLFGATLARTRARAAAPPPLLLVQRTRRIIATAGGAVNHWSIAADARPASSASA
jgi:hypothetical protein